MSDAEFGSRLIRRVTPRTGIRRRVGHARPVGAVGRATVGFGQAVGRSRGTRPEVTVGSLTSARLRPPSGWWHTLGEHGEMGVVAEQPSWTDDLVPPTRHTPRITHRKAAPAIARRTPAPPPAPAEPVTPAIAPTGLGRLDALRGMIAAGVAPDGSSISPEILQQQRLDDDSSPGEDDPPAPGTAARRPVPPPPPAGRGSRFATGAGPGTGPGSLGRRMQPELVEPGTRSSGSPTPPPAPSGATPTARRAPAWPSDRTDPAPTTAPAASTAQRPHRPRLTEPVPPPATAPGTGAFVPAAASRPDQPERGAPRRTEAPTSPPDPAAPAAAGSTEADARRLRAESVRRQLAEAGAAVAPMPRTTVGSTEAPSDRPLAVADLDRHPPTAQPTHREDDADASSLTPRVDTAAPAPAPPEPQQSVAPPAGADPARHAASPPTRPSAGRPDASPADRARPRPADPAHTAPPAPALGRPEPQRPIASPAQHAAPPPTRPTAGRPDASPAEHARRQPGDAAHAGLPEPTPNTGLTVPAPADIARHRPAPIEPAEHARPQSTDAARPSPAEQTAAALDERPPRQHASRPGSDVDPTRTFPAGAEQAASGLDEAQARATTAEGRPAPAGPASDRGPALRPPTVPPAARPEPGAATPSTRAPGDVSIRRRPDQVTEPGASRRAATPSVAGAPTDVRPGPASRHDRVPPTTADIAADGHQVAPGPTGSEPARPVVGPPAIARRQPDARHEPTPPAAGWSVDRAVGFDDQSADRPVSEPPASSRRTVADTPQRHAMDVARRSPPATPSTPIDGNASVAPPLPPRPPAMPVPTQPITEPETVEGPGPGVPALRAMPSSASLPDMAEPASRSTTVSRSELRRQRLIGSDPARPMPALPATPAGDAQGTATAPATPPVAPPAARPRPRRAAHRRAAPALPGASHDGAPTEHPIRRVTLPRAMSAAHRPAATAAQASVRPPAPAGGPATAASSAGIDPGSTLRRALAADPARSEAGAALADRFLRELSHTAQPRPAALPTPFRPMAEQIAGRRPVMLSTDPASRRALRKVGKRAATTGSTIHIDATARDLVTPSARMAEVVAHELTHVAHPSPAPRFFDDIDESPEERRAERIARTIATSPLAPAASPIASPHAVLRRSPSPTSPTRSTMPHHTTPATPGTIDAATLAASITGEPAIIRRQHTVAVPAPQATTPPAAPSPAPPATASTTGAASPAPVVATPAAAARDERSPAERDEEFRALLERNLDVILRRVEDHILIDIERRGGRAWRGF